MEEIGKQDEAEQPVDRQRLEIEHKNAIERIGKSAA